MELREALIQISEIRQQMAATQVFRGYRAATTAFSGVLAVLAAVAQAVLIPDPAEHVDAYLALWGSVALLSIAVVGVAMGVRYVKSGSELQREITLAATEQFVPCLVAGGLLTYVMRHSVYWELWMLPGLWAILFAMGIFSSRRLLPRPVAASGGYYLLAGLLCLGLARGKASFSPWVMAATFGGGQFLTAVILWWTLERGDGRE